ncbi:DUF2264 domain-containing protein [Massilia varians]|uniref:DUF2264 domain-containing protein n=1 Tax=Massilia sp. LC238 TaxID=1502852 RepID=UPI0004E35EB4|nr:DUF2264 domain-containing protein [Massilia sp. LC238]KFC76327.1 putative unsaturated glucuronyl hydrolase [Massilia sp. LC238]
MNTSRRSFLHVSAATGLAFAMPTAGAAGPGRALTGTRDYWLKIADKLGRPVLENLSRGTLKASMPVEQQAGKGRENFSHLEAFGRLLSGIAPWLELTGASGNEKTLQALYIGWARASLERATNPASPDFMNFNRQRQPLVDASYVALAMLRAPRALWEPLSSEEKGHVIAALESTRKLANPIRNNWVMFAATIECFLMMAGRSTEFKRFENNIQVMLNWYVGDGTYGDGKSYHADYYNGYVIQPMLVDCLEYLQQRDRRFVPAYEKVLARSIRHAAIQERMIAPDGSFPPLGRSLPYRCGAFQTLAQMALMDRLPKPLQAAQVREALGAVIGRTMEPAGTFDSNGWLRIGLAGHQPRLGEEYVSTGSLYIAANALLPLGLPPAHGFWSASPVPWTAQQVWAGADVAKDAALRDEHEITLPVLQR